MDEGNAYIPAEGNGQGDPGKGPVDDPSGAPRLEERIASAPAGYSPEDARERCRQGYEEHQRTKRKLGERSYRGGDLDDQLNELDQEDTRLAIMLKSDSPIIRKLYEVLNHYNLLSIDPEKELEKVVASCHEVVGELGEIVKELNNDLYGKDYHPGRKGSLDGLYGRRKELAMGRLKYMDAIKGAKSLIRDLEVQNSSPNGNGKSLSPDEMGQLYEEKYEVKRKLEECQRDLVSYESVFEQKQCEIKGINEDIAVKETAVRIAQDVINDATKITSYYPETRKNREVFRLIPLLTNQLRGKLNDYIVTLEGRRRLEEQQEEIIAREVEGMAPLVERTPEKGMNQKSPLANLSVRHEDLSDRVAADIEILERNPFEGIF